MTEPLAYEGTGYEVLEGEPPEVLGRNLISASYLLAGATAFFFIAFVFAYFYLRSLDNAGMWKPKGIDASVAWGTVVVACYAASALLVGVAGLVLQVLAWTHESFGPADGGYASVYFGWTAFLFLFVLGTLIWLEMTWATSYRYRGYVAASKEVPAGHASGDSGRSAHDIRDPLSLVRAELVGLSFYWTFLAGIAVVSWIILYLV